MKIVRTIADVRSALAELRSSTATVGLVPTMGALHEGHRSLLRAARESCSAVVLSLFVNPAQFGQAEDLDRYPRDEAGDAEMAAAAGVDLLFAPATDGDLPRRLRHLGRAGKARHLPRRGRPARPLPWRGDRLRSTLQHRRAEPRLLRSQGRAAGRRGETGGPRPRAAGRDRRLSQRCAMPMAWPSRAATGSCRRRSTRSHWRCRAPCTRGLPRIGPATTRCGRRVACSIVEPGLRVEYVAEVDLDGPTLAAAVVVGSTRLIDNVRLIEEA